MKISNIAAFFLAASVASAQQDATTPTFRAGTKLIEVDVIAKTKGAPAKSLTKEDFSLTDNGKPQSIAFFSVRSTSNRRNLREPPLPPDTYSNRLVYNGDSPSRTTVILLDQINTPQELQGYAIPRVAKFVDSQHGADRLAIYTLTWGGLHVMQDLTSNRDLLKRAASRLKGRDPNPRINDTTGMSQHEAEGYDAMNVAGPALAVKDAMEQISSHLAGVPGRKTLVWVTTAFPLIMLNLGLDFRPEMEGAAHALNNANIALYAVDARGIIGALGGITGIAPADSKGPPPSPQIINLMMHRNPVTDPRGLNTEQMVSGLTGGRTFFDNSNAIEESIESAVEDGDFTYTLGFYPDKEMQDGKWHDIKVHVSRQGIQLRYRTSYFARREGDEYKAAPTLDRILREPLDSAEIALRAEAHSDPAHARMLNLNVNIDLHDVAFTHANSSRTAAIDLSFYLDGANRVFTKPLKIEIPDNQFDAVLEKGINATAPIDITGSAGALRIVAQDKTTGTAGSLTLPLPAH